MQSLMPRFEAGVDLTSNGKEGFEVSGCTLEKVVPLIMGGTNKKLIQEYSGYYIDNNNELSVREEEAAAEAASTAVIVALRRDYDKPPKYPLTNGDKEELATNMRNGEGQCGACSLALLCVPKTVRKLGI